MVKAIEKVDDSLSYTDLAIAVAEIIKEQYGDHNIAPFMKELHKQLSIKESVNEDEEVFMASNSLNKIIEDATELLDKIGEEEINLPAWIQDHITKAEECLNHANQGFYVEEGVEESDIFEKEFSTEERKKLADKGVALPDGSFPIETVADLKNAIHAYGRAKNQADAAKHIAKRAKALGHEDLIPDSDDFQKSLKESKYNGNVAGDAAEYIAKELSHYVKGIIDQPNDNVTYFHLKDKSYKSKVIKTLKDVYGLEAQDGGTQFSPSATIKFDNDVILETKDSDTFVGNPGEDERMVDIRAFRGSVKDLTSFIEDKIKENQK